MCCQGSLVEAAKLVHSLHLEFRESGRLRSLVPTLIPSPCDLDKGSELGLLHKIFAFATGNSGNCENVFQEISDHHTCQKMMDQLYNGGQKAKRGEKEEPTKIEVQNKMKRIAIERPIATSSTDHLDHFD